MYYVNPKHVMNLFRIYLAGYENDMISKQAAIDELQDALDSAECELIEKDGDT